ncbi:MAG: DUF4405 domain-containing protein [Anaerolineae bacterium]|nr:DUF4405 domain-containing protein [Anaerolineae bacterium]
MESITTIKKSITSKTKVNLILDSILLLIFLVVYQEKATGEVIHEWLGVGIAVAIIIHILLHWQWVVSITQRFFQKIKTEPRINYILNAGLFVCFTTIVFSGLMISRSVLPFFGLEGADSSFWKMLHVTAAEVSLWLVALHVALHWRWILDAIKRYIVTPVSQYFGRPKNQLKPKPVHSKL